MNNKNQTDRSDRTDGRGDPIERRANAEPLHDGRRLRPSGGYRQLRSFQVTTIIYDATVSFCGRFLNQRSRTVDQMVQAARSGRQNIAEGSRASATSSQTELRLVNVARASLDELLLDYEDYLRQHGKPLWNKADPEALAVRALGRQHPTPADRSNLSDVFGAYASRLNHADPALVANTVVCLIHQANYLLDQQIATLERQFINEGGYSERLAAARLAERGKQRRSDPPDRSNPNDPPDSPQSQSPACPRCGKQMTL